MGRVSKKEDKSVYQKKREELGLSREKASEQLCMSSDRLEKIENGKPAIRPEEVLAMSDEYKSPKLCNYYCANECPIGIQYVPEVEMKSLSEIVLGMVASLNAMGNKKDRLIEITADGLITADEIKDFVDIQQSLEDISITVEMLQLWVEQMMDNGKIDMEAYNSYIQTQKK